MKDYSIGIVGYGVVGKGIHKLLFDYTKAIYDPFVKVVENEKAVGRSKDDFKNLDLIVICVMTKANEDGSCDSSIIEDSLNWINEEAPNIPVLIKSAVVPGKVEEIIAKYPSLNIIVSPEYMGESKYYTPFWKYPDPENMASHTWQIFGGKRKFTSLCIDIFKKRMSVDTRFIQTDVITASLCKYMENSFYALKITFCNEWYSIAERFGVDYNELRECWLADPRINRNHTLVFPKDRGYGGKCFPKDVKAIINDSENKGFSPELMKKADEINSLLRNSKE